MTIRHVDSINGTPLVSLVVAGWHELFEAGFAAPDVGISYDHKAYYAEMAGSGEIAGILVYNDEEWRKAFFVTLGYVLPKYRRAGVYRKLWEALVAGATEKGRLRILGATHVNNETMRAVHESLGRKETFVTYEFEVPGVNGHG